jgi:soluble lytic murein transglycosylase-like protein
MTPELRAIIEEKAKEYDVDPDLVQAFCCIESSYEPKATRYEPNFYARYIRPMVFAGRITADEGMNRATSWGIMQIMGQVAREKGFNGEFSELFDPATALEWSLKHLKHFIVKYASLNDAIASYNAGSPRMNDNKYVNQQYVDKIHKALLEIKGVA